MKRIKLTQGKFALVDDEDYDWLMTRKWHAKYQPNGFYARTNHYRPMSGPLPMHRFILGLTDPNIYVDHKDGNGLNNQRSNLRIATKAQNSYNRRYQIGASKYKGVSWDGEQNKWRARIGLLGKRMHLGRFKNQKDAAMAYNKKAVEVYGEFAFLNKI